jgi:hypothetical protein
LSIAAERDLRGDGLPLMLLLMQLNEPLKAFDSEMIRKVLRSEQ